MTMEKSTEIARILEAQEMRGEQIVNHIRMGFTLLSVLLFASHAWTVNTHAANVAFAIMLAVWFVYSSAVYVYFRLRPGVYSGWLKYVSISVDLGVITLTSIAYAKNYSGLIEYFLGYAPAMTMLWNLISGFRYSLRACLYSAVLSVVFSSAVLVYTVWTGAIPISPISVYGQNAINISDQIQQIIYIATAGVVAGILARITRGLVLRAEVESRERTRLEHEKHELGKYLSQEFVEFVLSDPSRLKLGGSRRHVTVMFTDIRNFTPLTESVEPELVVSFLNEYFTEMVEIVFKYGGTLDKYIGDGLMAVFGAPFSVEDAPKRAVLAAIEMIGALERMNKKKAMGFGDIDMGVGIATGTVISGNIGSLQRMEYTCIGDTVNTAARLEQINKELGSRIIVCEATHAALGTAIPSHAAGTHLVRGKSQQVHPHVVDHERMSAERFEVLKRALFEMPTRIDSMLPRAIADEPSGAEPAARAYARAVAGSAAVPSERS